MSHITLKTWNARIARLAALFVVMLFSVAVRAAVPGVAGPTFDLTAEANRISQPDGQSIYSWGYGCNPRTPVSFLPSANSLDGANCQSMQVPGPTLIVKQGDVVTITLTNNLPAAAGNTSILFPGFQVCAAQLKSDGTCPTTLSGVPGLLTQEATHGGTVTYSFVASTPGTHAYYSGTQGDLQIEMGLYGALVVLPASGGTTVVPTGCHAVGATLPDGQPDYRDAASAYNHSATCYDREYLFQFSEIDPRIHTQAEQQASVACRQPTGCMTVQTEPYHPAYYLINGRSMPDDMDTNYAPQYPHQPYNGNPHMHPGELVLLRIIGTGRWQHPFHEHANHVRVLARDGNLLLSASDRTKLAGPLLFTTTTTPGITMDGIFYWTGKGLNWDVYGNTSSGPGSVYNIGPTDTLHASYNGKPVVCIPDANGYYTKNADGSSAAGAPNYFEWCPDHDKPLEAHPFGAVASGGPVTLPDPNVFANGAWYSGSAYLGPDALIRAVGATGTTPPSGLIVNSPTTEAGFAYMWHSHNEREITTNNIFPGGMMMMMLVDPQAFTINESN